MLHAPSAGLTACIDTPEVGPIVAACERRGWKLTHILNTHHHYDHAGGNDELKRRFGCKVIGPAAEKDKIPSIDEPVSGGDAFAFGGHEVRVIDVGGHTLGQVAYHLPDANAAFVGDALFALGCGRLFEGTPSQAWASLQRLAALPPETAVFCAHEYTEANLRFALTIEPGNLALQRRAEVIRDLRSQDKPTVPTTIGLELETNPFLRPSSSLLRSHLGVPKDETEEVTFARVRRMKDNA
uniref:hydroxyacylglutathione hydrolase n=1 Tax=Haptolina ericina TaxID=156174 RepID=A0A7S3BU34_9EUKA